MAHTVRLDNSSLLIKFDFTDKISFINRFSRKKTIFSNVDLHVLTVKLNDLQKDCSMSVSAVMLHYDNQYLEKQSVETTRVAFFAYT